MKEQNISILKYYQNSTIYPAIAVVVGTIIYSIYESQDYKSEWLTHETIVAYTFLMSLVFCVVYALACLPILLIHFEVIRKNKLYTFLCWFLLPVSIMIFILSRGKDEVYLAIMNVPFPVGLVFTYLYYLRMSKKVL